MSTTTKNIQNKTTTIVNDLPAVEAPKVPQHVICKELAEKGYKAKQVSEITGISYNNVAWYFSKYGLTKIANEKLKELFPEVTNNLPTVDELPKAPKTTKVSKTIETKKEEVVKVDPKKEEIKKIKKESQPTKVSQRQSKK